MIHAPDILILDEPTSGVDPQARDDFWRLLVDLSRNDGVTIFVSTHFMDEALRCDRISLMHAGRVLVTDTPAAIIRSRNAATLENAFVAYISAEIPPGPSTGARLAAAPEDTSAAPNASGFGVRRLLAFTGREANAVSLVS